MPGHKQAAQVLEAMQAREVAKARTVGAVHCDRALLKKLIFCARPRAQSVWQGAMQLAV